MLFDTAQSIRVAINEADEAIRRAVLDGNVLNVMHQQQDVIVSVFFLL